MTALSDEIDAMIAEHGGRVRDALNIAMARRDALRAELADVRAQWQADVGSAIARALTAEARVTAMELERDAARAEAARYAEALANSDPWTNDVPFNCVYCDAVWGSDIGSSENQHNAGCVWIAAAALRGPAQSEKRE